MKTHACPCGVCQLKQAEKRAEKRARIEGYIADLSAATGSHYAIGTIITGGDLNPDRVNISRNCGIAFGTLGGVSLGKAAKILADALNVATCASETQRSRM
jgi:hypothetical protein